MCELLGIAFDRRVDASFSMRRFSLRDEENADGWGIAWYENGSLSLVKEPIAWRESSYATFLDTYEHLRSRIFVAHVRKRTRGGSTHADTHPFVRELFGRAYCFAHNGTVVDHERLPLGRNRPMGGTDSEHLFCHLLAEIEERGGPLETEEDWRWLAAKLEDVNAASKLNCLLSDGERLFAHRDANGWKGLTMRVVTLDGERGTSHLGDRATEVELERELPEAEGVVVATNPLSDLGWHALRNGELVVVEAGRLSFSSHRSSRVARA